MGSQGNVASERAGLFRAALLDIACVLAGGLGYLLTDNLVWLIGGLMLGAGFILPALIRLVRAQR